MAKVTVTFPKAEVYIKQLGLDKGGRVQKVIDNEIIRLSEPYVPLDTGATRDSAYKNTKIGSGTITYEAYGNAAPGRNIWNDERANVHWQDAPHRGPKWVLRAWQSGVKEKVMLAVQKLLKKG
jgi:hypothetical protein